METLAQLVAAVGQALTFTFQPNGRPETQLIHYLQDKELLLVLDNFEQLVRSTSRCLCAPTARRSARSQVADRPRGCDCIQDEQLYGLPVPMTIAPTAQPDVAELATCACNSF